MKYSILLTAAVLLSGCANNAAMQQWFGVGSQVARDMGYGNQAELVNGVKEVLEITSTRAAGQLSADGGYARAGFPIDLPSSLQPVASTLRQFGLGAYVDKLETAMQDGAEKAAAQATPVFHQAIAEMSVTDALGIIQGGNDAATQYFRSQTESTLRQRYQPVIQDSLKQTGFYDQYKTMLSVYDNLPLTEKPNLDLESLILEQSLNGLFARMAEEEALIRQDPIGRGSALLGTILGASGSTQ